MIGFYFLMSSIYAGVFYSYMHNHKDNVDLWHHYSSTNWDSKRQEYFTTNTPMGEWNGIAIALFLLGIFFWPLIVPAILVFRLANKFFKNKNNK